MKIFSGAAARLLVVSAGLAGSSWASGPTAFQGPGELLVAPTRVTLDSRTRAAELLVLNRGKNTATYRLSLVEMRMLPDGRLERVKEGELKPGELSAKSLVRFAPRQVTLDPGESQHIRVGIQRPPNLATGEYRSHLLLEAVPNAVTPDHPGASDSISIRFNVVGAVSLPIVVRQGSLSASAELAQPQLQNGHFLVRLQRNGSRSIRGDLTVFFVPEGSKKRVHVGTAREMPVYFPNAERMVKIPLSQAVGRGKLIATFEEPNGVAGRAKATVEMTISP